jgi:hypothetical protein
MKIVPRLIAIALRKYSERPSECDAAVKMLLRNGVRLAIHHLGRKQAEALVQEALRETLR